MLVLVIWWNPEGRKPGVWSELLQEPFVDWDAAREFVHERKAINGASKYQMRNLDPLLRRRGIRAVPASLVEAVKAGAMYVEKYREATPDFESLMDEFLHIHETIDVT